MLDPVAHRVERSGQQLRLGPTEYRLLRFFMEHPRRVFTRGQLLDAVWGNDSDIGERTVDVHIQRLRQKLDAGLIETVYKFGYRFIPGGGKRHEA